MHHRALTLAAALALFGCHDVAIEPHPSSTPSAQVELPVSSPHLGPNDRFIEVGGTSLRLREEGPTDAPAIILLHGFTDSLETWDDWADALQADYRIIRYDLLGHGLTGPDPQKRYAPQERADFLIEVMDALGLETVIGAGNSLGGTIMWRAAAAHPDRFDRIALLDAGIFDFSGVETAPGDPPLAMKAALTAPNMMTINFFTSVNFADPSRISQSRRQSMLDMMLQEGNGQAFLDHIAEFTMPDPSELLAALSTPTLILWGEEDRLIPVDHAIRADEILPISQLQIISGGGHALQEDKPDDSLNAFKAFLVEVD